ncbi:MAG: radical SAM protein [Gemmatimonadetes bacterium]|uniref:Radical SAM protein n=1 Tax=Candidatus Kutchimonas denitrificans TaxID=3056748 RepID=A0AAE4ZDD5_9BACT|nr:radical SAM protein [Gemmatimonadota bacterium]NIR76270.1 radical SAM protein [Candidatus Kutchimonas denitrificans]NIS02293.1 radical SAM protein [Gemmatimonadota bacterium]NIT68112.1 radical SAM protein [Gemmatimonadota bacterium]NIU54336.1 radical SAM protein [Gemmatimonadota bacterium]
MYRSHVISWNLTKKCNLRCEHCYISAGRISKGEARDELSTEECLRVVDGICEVNPEALLILTGGEPLLRKDVFEIASYANSKGLWVVVGTNGVLITPELCRRMIEAGIRGVALSLDSLEAATHDAFRGVQGAWDNTVEGSKVLRAAGLPFIVQTTIGRHNRDSIVELARFAHELGARVYNLYFLVPTGRGAYTSDISADEYEETLAELMKLQEEFAGRMLVNSKCAPHYQRMLYQNDPDSPFLKSFAAGAGGCPAGTHYLGIRPNGDMTPCPYLPVYGGNLRQRSFREIWEESDVFQRIRRRKTLGGRCGACEFNSVCGGCRARAYGATGDFMAEDPWCVYEPGAYGFEPISFAGKTTYGMELDGTLPWTAEARARLERVPSFVRGMLAKRMESYAAERGQPQVTAELMQEVRERTLSGRIGNVPSFVRKMLEAESGAGVEDDATPPGDA